MNQQGHHDLRGTPELVTKALHPYFESAGLEKGRKLMVAGMA